MNNINDTAREPVDKRWVAVHYNTGRAGREPGPAPTDTISGSWITTKNMWQDRHCENANMKGPKPSVARCSRNQTIRTETKKKETKKRPSNHEL